MNEQSGSTNKVFLAGIALFGVLIVGGLIWAIMLPSSGRQNVSPGTPEQGLVFDDTDDPITGSATSSVIVRMFGDFQCPACKAAEPGVTYARSTYGDKVKFIWNDFPLPSDVHPNAMISAIAARCAENQGKFWEYHDILYQSQSTWAPEKDPKDLFVTYAKSIGMKDPNAFATCLMTQPDKQKITNDAAEGARNNVTGTPTFFINDRRFVGGLDNAQWDTVLKAELARS